MKIHRLQLIVILFFACNLNAQIKWNTEQEELIETIDKLSATTAKEGAGAEAYGSFLSTDFSRWTLGSQLINKKAAWIKAVDEWFVDGWYVSDRETEYIDIRIQSNLAFVRRIVSETYTGPKGDQSKSKASLAEIWQREKGRWLLKRVDVKPET